LFHRSVAFFQTQQASISVRGQRMAVAMEHIRTYLLARKNNRTATSLRLLFRASANVVDLDFNIFDSERLITEVEKRPALYNLLID